MKRNTPLKRTGLLRRTQLKPVSKKRAKEARIYAKKRKAFLEAHPFCEVWLVEHGLGGVNVSGGTAWTITTQTGERCPASVDIHHKAGRSGKNYLDESTWMAVSREGHEWIHAHPSEARAKGWLV